MTNDIKAMTDTELSKYAVTLSKWSWCPGMRVFFLNDNVWARVFTGYIDSDRLFINGESLGWWHELPAFLARHPDALPDMTDPATLGCIRSVIGELNGHGSFEVPAMYAVMFHQDLEAGRLTPTQALARVLVMELSSFDDDEEEVTR